MKKHMQILPVFLVAVVALILGAAVPRVQAQNEPPVCWFNIELNGSEIDVGVRGFFDYEPWKMLTIEDPDGNVIDTDTMENSMEEQGKAEFFFESGEPVIGEDDFTLSVFLNRFPEGDYDFDAVTIEEDEVECHEYFSHAMPCAAEVCASGSTSTGVTINWDPVTQVVDAAATDDTGGEELVCTDPHPKGAFKIVGYEVIVEIDESGKIFDINLPPSATSVTVPPEFIKGNEKKDFKYEVLAIEASGNQTTIEEHFGLDHDGNVTPSCD